MKKPIALFFSSREDLSSYFSGIKMVKIAFDPEIMQKLDDGSFETLYLGKGELKKEILSLAEVL